MKLFLSGGGVGEKSAQIDQKFVDSLDKSKPLLYIPIAINALKHPYPSCINWIKSALAPFDVKEITMWTEKELKKAKEENFNQFCGIYIGGGNTFKLLKELKEFNIYKILKNLAKKGMPIYGGSAGAVIMGKTINTASFQDTNEVKLKDLTGLNLIKGYEIWPHYNKDTDNDIINYQNTNSVNVIGLPEDSGLYVTENFMEVIDPGSAFIFTPEKKEIKPKENILLMF